MVTVIPVDKEERTVSILTLHKIRKGAVSYEDHWCAYKRRGFAGNECSRAGVSSVQRSIMDFPYAASARGIRDFSMRILCR